jgi:prepilin-type N-terminal cleavage/methylation domain-containing protein
MVKRKERCLERSAQGCALAICAEKKRLYKMGKRVLWSYQRRCDNFAILRLAAEEKPIGFKSDQFVKKGHQKWAFTLVELLVVIAIIALILAISGPVFIKAKSNVRKVVGTNNQRQIVGAVNLYALDNDEIYPESISTVGDGDNWNWYDPRALASWNNTASHHHRSVGAYLRSYIKNANTMFCPNAPRKHKYLQASWDAEDNWNNPDTTFDVLAVRGTYCLYWNYVGWLGENRLFKGPRNPAGRRGESKVLVSCYLGYGNMRAPDAYGSCERFKGADVVPETLIESAWWSHPNPDGKADLSKVSVRPCAGYTDGHVESFAPSEAIPMKAIMIRATNQPYTGWISPGDFYLPRNGLR